MAKPLPDIPKRVVCIGASMGGLARITELARRLDTCPEPLIIVQHIGNGGDEPMRQLVARETQKPVRIIQDKMPIRNSEVYLAPPNYHSLIDFDGTFSLDASERVCYSRPSIDVMFESCAMVFGSHCVGVILTGSNTDGSLGMKKVQAAKGVLLVEAPDLADYPQMPLGVLAICTVDQCGSTAQIAETLAQMSLEVRNRDT